MANRILAVAALVGASAIVGCRTMEDVKRDYNSNMAAGNYAAAVPEVSEYAAKSGVDQLMWQLMSGSAYRLTGDGANASRQFDLAEDTMIGHDQASVFSKGASGAWAMMTNDKVFD
jgi:hypothetical protein